MGKIAPAGIYLFKINNRNTSTMYEICANDAVLVSLNIFNHEIVTQTTTLHFHDFTYCSGFYIVDFE